MWQDLMLVYARRMLDVIEVSLACSQISHAQPLETSVGQQP